MTLIQNIEQELLELQRHVDNLERLRPGIPMSGNYMFYTDTMNLQLILNSINHDVARLKEQDYFQVEEQLRKVEKTFQKVYFSHGSNRETHN